MMDDLDGYRRFIVGKGTAAARDGFAARDLPDGLFGHQRHMVEFACAAGSAGCFYDTGLGKTAIELAWADQVRRHAGGSVLVLAPLAVGRQIVAEAARFGIDRVAWRAEQAAVRPGDVAVSNYERLHLFRPGAFAGVVLDESSIIKSFTGVTTRRLIEAWRDHRYRLAATATPAPNDHMELGQHSAFLGVMPASEMLTRWFVADQSAMGRYRLKGHGVGPFWRWVASWAQAATRPSDVGPYDDAGYDLLPFELIRHVVDADAAADTGGLLFRIPDTSATAIHAEKRRTVEARVRVVADLVGGEGHEPWIVWCDTDYEADALKRVLPDAAEVRGSHPPRDKERRLQAFADGSDRVLITKPSVAGFGLNWQHCARVAFVGLSFSYEAFYQAVRRCWRFGQGRQVQVHVAMADTERAVWDVIARKRDEHATLARRMVAAMRSQGRSERLRTAYVPRAVAVPAWLQMRDQAEGMPA